jgi:hypothetical protein
MTRRGLPSRLTRPQTPSGGTNRRRRLLPACYRYCCRLRRSPAARPTTTSPRTRLDIRSYLDTARRPQAWRERHGRPVQPHARRPLAVAIGGVLPINISSRRRYPSLHLHGLNVYI